MVQAGDQIIMSIKERELEIEAVVLKTLEKVNSPITPIHKSIKTLTVEGVMNLFHKSRTTIDSYRRRKKNPLPMVGTPPLIEEEIAWEWYKNHSGDYQPE
jgi:hypothetical protein